MKNRILRSALSVALCAAMLLSQGLTAFADGEIDLAAAKSSPVQESSEELVPGASDLKPEIKNVVLPQRAARSAAPEIETYSIPDSSGYTEILGYQALVDDCELHVYINGTDSQNPSGNIELTDSNDVETTFPQGTGFRIFEASPSENWIFDEWQTHIYLKKLIDENTIDSENHSSAGKTAFGPSGNSILVNRLAALGETIVNKVYYSVYANFNPTVSVTVNGASQDEAVFIYPNNKVENTGRYEVDYGDGITITANEGYKITSVTVDGEEIESVDGTSYTLTDVIKPHDIVVTVEKTGGEPDLPPIEDGDEILNEILVKTECSENPSHNQEKKLSELVINDNYRIAYNNDESTATITLNDVTGIVNLFYPNGDPHTASSSSPENITLKYEQDKWSFAEESKNTFTINVSCQTQPVEPEEAIVQLVIYRNGNTEKPYQNIVLEPALMGSTLEIDFDINDYYTQEDYGAGVTHFDFDGWYNDGGWNDYKAGNPNNTLPDSITINGWTNIIGMVNDYEKIIVHTVINGDTKNAKQYYVGEALHGTSLLNFLNEHKDETMPSLEGYTTNGKWYNLDHPGQEITDQTTVNGWTNLYVNFVAEGTDPGTNPGGDEGPDNPGGGDNGNNGGNNNGGSTGGGSSVSRRDDDDDWEPLPNNNYRVTKKNDKPSQNTQIVVRDPADNSDNTSSNTGSDSGKHNPETGDTTTAFAAMALAAVSLGGVVLLGRKKK